MTTLLLLGMGMMLALAGLVGWLWSRVRRLEADTEAGIDRLGERTSNLARVVYAQEKSHREFREAGDPGTLALWRMMERQERASVELDSGR